MAIADEVETLFRRAEPRLRRIARAQRIAPDGVEDIVQETLLEAWRSLHHLRDEAAFAAWLDGICRNICLRHLRQRGILHARETGLDGDDEAVAALPDPDICDPAEELTRRDMALLLDRALGHLAPENRVMVERHYLAEIPQPELAAQMGMTLGALESRLHRARKQLLTILSDDLRDDALALGLAVAPEPMNGWRTTSIWCIFCGQQRLRGIFEPLADGRISMRLCCPRCEQLEMNSVGMVDLTHARSFLPATKRLVDAAARIFLSALAAGGICQCPICQVPTRLRLVTDQQFSRESGVHTWLASDCGCFRSIASVLTLGLPAVRAFAFASDRVVVGPEQDAVYDGQSALRFTFCDLTSGREMHVFTEAATLRPLATVVE